MKSVRGLALELLVWLAVVGGPFAAAVLTLGPEPWRDLTGGPAPVCREPLCDNPEHAPTLLPESRP